MVGSALAPFLSGAGHDVCRLVRSAGLPGSIRWNPDDGTIDRAGIEGCDAVVHLAGENIAGGRWTAARKARIRDSRVKGTRLLSETLAGMARPPRVLVSASAIGYYGDRGNELLLEGSDPGTGFLPGVCRSGRLPAIPPCERESASFKFELEWCSAAREVRLGKCFFPSRWALAARSAPGEQYMSWITLSDLCAVILQCIETEALHGPVNAVSPFPVTNLEFTRTLGRVLSCPTVFPFPGFAARIVLGEMADGLLLASARVEPAKLVAAGFRFQHGELESALRAVLSVPA